MQMYIFLMLAELRKENAADQLWVLDFSISTGKPQKQLSMKFYLES